MKNQGIYCGKCEDCNKMNTDSKKRDGSFQCASCSNDEYFRDLRNGNRVELKIYLPDYKKGTLEEIKMVLAKNKLI